MSDMRWEKDEMKKGRKGKKPIMWTREDKK